MSDEVQRSLGRIEGKLNALVDSFAEHSTDMEKRIRKVENKQHWYAGIGTAAGSFIGLLTGHTFKF